MLYLINLQQLVTIGEPVSIAVPVTDMHWSVEDLYFTHLADKK